MTDVHLHTAGLDIVMGTILFTDGFQLGLQDQCHNQTNNNTDHQTDQQGLACLEGVTVDISIQICFAPLRKTNECRRIMSVGKIVCHDTANHINLIRTDGSSGIAVAQDLVFPGIHADQQQNAVFFLTIAEASRIVQEIGVGLHIAAIHRRNGYDHKLGVVSMADIFQLLAQRSFFDI